MGSGAGGRAVKKQILGCAKDDRKKSKSNDQSKSNGKSKKQILGCAKDDRKKSKSKSTAKANSKGESSGKCRREGNPQRQKS
jgi:hypothetical protein